MKKIFLLAAMAAVFALTACKKDAAAGISLAGTVWKHPGELHYSVVTFADESNMVEQTYHNENGSPYGTHAYKYTYDAPLVTLRASDGEESSLTVAGDKLIRYKHYYYAEVWDRVK